MAAKNVVAAAAAKRAGYAEVALEAARRLTSIDEHITQLANIRGQENSRELITRLAHVRADAQGTGLYTQPGTPPPLIFAAEPGEAWIVRRITVNGLAAGANKNFVLYLNSFDPQNIVEGGVTNGAGFYSDSASLITYVPPGNALWFDGDAGIHFYVALLIERLFVAKKMVSETETYATTVVSPEEAHEEISGDYTGTDFPTVPGEHITEEVPEHPPDESIIQRATDKLLPNAAAHLPADHPALNGGQTH